ncbi:MAG: M48 family metallopeptidase [Methanotrichaceae archaeon]|nr:M48 family metallopeptidase [Methanotrichaceae archaeon]
MEVVVKRSKRRRKTIQARMVDGKMEVLAPYSIPEAALVDHISHLKERLIKRSLPRDNSGLEARAQHLNHKYFEGKLTWNSITYSTNQKRRRGSCSVYSRTIRISQKMSEMPRWVEDYVIVHELAHLIEPNHGKRFKALVHRYPLAERAIGFLIASETLNGNS